ncbi:hypothetical protein ACOME3_010581 [Neoechinorhynchus agilis]
MLRDCHHFDNVARHPVRTRQVYFHSLNNSLERDNPLIEVVPSRPSMEMVMANLRSTDDTSLQMKRFWAYTKMTEIDVRLRFFVASILQDAFTGLFPECTCLPFGSSVSHLGRSDCDLDLVFCFEDYRNEIEKVNESRFQFLTKKSFLSDRLQAQIYLKIFADVIKHFIPECFEVQIILPAKVPIVRFFHRSSGVWCDISMSDFTGSYYMSKLLSTLSRIDGRVAPLFFSIRHWAKQTGVTRSNPGPWISNFQLTILTIYFLQQLSKPIIPKLVSSTSEQHNELRISSLTTKNSDTLSDLLFGFFQFYKDFNPSETVMSLYESPALPDVNLRFPLMIENPLSPGLCASKNISLAEWERFKSICEHACSIMNANGNLCELFAQQETPSNSLDMAYPSPVYVAPDIDNDFDFETETIKESFK